jgi:hypothetical protein
MDDKHDRRQPHGRSVGEKVFCGGLCNLDQLLVHHRVGM